MPNVPPEPPPPGPLGEPILSGIGTGMTEQKLWRYVLRTLGGNITDVELTSKGDKDPVTGQIYEEDETHQHDCFADARRWFAYRVGFKKIVQVRLSNNQSAYIMPPETIEVVDVQLPNFQLPTIDADQFSYTYYTLLFGQWTNPNVAPLPYSDLVQRLQYLEQIGRIFSSDRDWEYHPNTRILEIYPAPGSLASPSFYNSSAGSAALVTILSYHIEPTQLDPQDLDLFKRKLVICAMRTLGNIRMKFDSIPSVGGDRSMNGMDLIGEASALEEKLEQDVLNWKRSVPLITG
jgi:hypothetical protein